MKKTTILTKASALLIVTVMFTLVLTGCTKTAVTTADFTALAQTKGYIVEDASSQFSAYDYIKEVTIVAPQSLDYQIEFYVLSDAAYAQSFFENNKTNFEMNKSGTYSDSSSSGKNYAVYKLNANDKYMFLERVDNTVVYVNTEKENKEAVEAFVKELKY